MASSSRTPYTRSAAKRGRSTNSQPPTPPSPQLQPPSPADAPPTSWSRLERSNFRTLGRLTYLPTRFLSEGFLDTLGIRRDVLSLLASMGLDQLSRLECTAYHGLTRQFLATLDADLGPEHGLCYASRGSITFKANDQLYHLTVEQICKAFGFRNGSYSRFGDFIDANEFWHIIGDEGQFNNARSKASSLRNPVLWMVHRFIAGTLFPRMDIRMVQTDELCLLLQGLRNKVVNAQGHYFGDLPSYDVNLGGVFAWALVRLQRWALTTTMDRPFTTISGMLIPLFVEAGVPLNEHYEAPNFEYINLEVLVSSRVLTRDARQDRYVYLFRDAQRRRRSFTLPNTELTNLGSQNNIEFHYGELIDVEPEEVFPTEQRPQGQDPSDLADTFSNMRLEPLPFQPETPREEYFFRQYDTQRRFNAWIMTQYHIQAENEEDYSSAGSQSL